MLAIRRGRRDLARAELASALEADAHSAAALTTLGNLVLEDGEVNDAIAHYEAAIRSDDAYAPAYHNLGVALRRAGKRGAAIRMLRRATALESRSRR